MPTKWNESNWNERTNILGYRVYIPFHVGLIKVIVFINVIQSRANSVNGQMVNTLWKFVFDLASHSFFPIFLSLSLLIQQQWAMKIFHFFVATLKASHSISDWDLCFREFAQRKHRNQTKKKRIPMKASKAFIYLNFPKSKLPADASSCRWIKYNLIYVKINHYHCDNVHCYEWRWKGRLPEDRITRPKANWVTNAGILYRPGWANSLHHTLTASHYQLSLGENKWNEVKNY